MAKAHGKGAWLSAYDSGKPTDPERTRKPTQWRRLHPLRADERRPGSTCRVKPATCRKEEQARRVGIFRTRKERTKTGSFRPARRLERHIPALAGPALPSLAQATWRHGARRSDTLSCRPDSSNAAHSAPAGKPPVRFSTLEILGVHPGPTGTAQTAQQRPCRVRARRPIAGCRVPPQGAQRRRLRRRARIPAPARHDPAQYRRHGNAFSVCPGIRRETSRSGL